MARPPRWFRGLEKAGWLIALAFLARAMATFAGFELFETNASAAPQVRDVPQDTDDDEESTSPTNPASLASVHTTDRILAYDIFCPGCVPDVEGIPGSPLPTPSGTETRTPLPLRVVATMESPDPTKSLATVYDADAEVSRPVIAGDLLRPDVVVLAIHAGVVHVQRGAALEFIDNEPLGKKPAKGKGKGKGEKKSRPGSKPKPRSEAEDSIKCSDEHTCTIEKAFLDKLLQNPAALAKEIRVSPAADGGFRLRGIRRRSLASTLGLKNGDVLRSINGRTINGIDQAMALYTQLRNARNLSVDIVRKGKPITKEVTIQ